MTEEEKKDPDTAKKGKKAPKAAKAAKEVSQMKAGDYTVHLLIQKAKDLEIDAEDVMDIICEVTVQTNKEVTKEIKDVTSTTVLNFDSHIFIELMGQSVAELEQTKILIKLQQKGFFKTSLIGQVELDLTFIYNLENHTKQHQWLAMINPDSEDFSSVAAYLKLSGSIYGVEDTPVELKADENDDDDNCIMPASMKPKYTQLKLHVVKGEHLPKLDVKMIGEGNMDAFVTAKIGGKTIKTSIKVTEKDEATWNETFMIPVRMPIMSGKLILNVMDLDTVTDEQAGALIFDFKELLQREQGSFFWANIYGAPGQEEVKLINTNSDLADEMNKDPMKATKWKGRILFGVEHCESESPKFGVESMSTSPPTDPETNEEIPGAKSIVQLSKDYQKQYEYLVMYEFNSVLNMPEHEGKFNLQLSMAEKVWTSGGGDRERAIGYNYNRWNQRSAEETVMLPYETVEDFDDIFLYLCPDKGGLGGLFGGKDANKVGKPVSYVKLRAADYQHPNPKLKWVEMQEEPIEDEVDSPELAGVVGFRLSIVRKDKVLDVAERIWQEEEDEMIWAEKDKQEEDKAAEGTPEDSQDAAKKRAEFEKFRTQKTQSLAEQPHWKKRLSKRPDSKKIRCYLFQAKDLPAADEDGASDPKVIIYNTVDQDSKKERMLKQVAQTSVVEQNCDPMFYELVELKIDYTKGEDLPPFILDVYDVDKKMIGDDDLDYLGRCVVNLEDSAHKYITEDTDTVDLKPEIPKWHPIRYQTGAAKTGEILLSFIITEEFDHAWKLPNEQVVMMGIKDDSAVVRFDEYQVELNVLGLRGLASPGLLPVKKAYIDFLLKSMVPPMAAQALTSIQTQPGPSGPDPTINSVISFNVPMPINDLYAPSMSCRVYDKVFKGFSGQLIGVFTIPIGQIMRDQKEEYDENCKRLDAVVKALEDVLNGTAILDYEPTQPAVDTKLVDDKKFRDEQRKQKAIVQKEMDKPKPEEKKSFTNMLADKIAPEPVKPTTALQKRLGQDKSNAMKKRLLVHTDEDSDSDGETYVNPVAKTDTETTKYVPPQLQLDLGAINGSSVSDRDINQLAATPRSQLSREDKQVVDQVAILDAISNKSDPNKLKNMTPKNNEPFKPPTATRLSQQDVEDALRSRSGANTPASVKSFTPSKSGMNKTLMQMAKNEEDAIKRETESARQIAEKEMAAKGSGKEVKLITTPTYKFDERLNCLKEVDQPSSMLFEELGWDRDPENPKEKHYRKFVTEELEHSVSVMSKPSEFHCYTLKRGQTRGASKSIFSFGSSKKDASGEEDTTTKMGLFKALISVTHRETEMETKMFMLSKLSKILRLLSEIYQQRFKKPFPIGEGFFGENALEGSKVMTAAQRERRYSDDAGGEPEDNFTNRLSCKSGQSKTTAFSFSDRASTVLNSEGRANFKKLMREMKLTHLQILRKVVDVQSDEIIKRLLMSEAKCFIRVYVVRAFNLAARDNDSPSDSYVKCILGEKEFSDRDNYKEDEASPEIYKMYQFDAIFPGCPLLKVQMWDYDMLFGDDLIGETIIDLEDRYFSSDFASFQHKPIEYRRLSHYSTEMSQGTVVMWAEINEQYASKEAAPEWDISKKPTEDFQVRVVIWDTEELEMMDGEGTTDGFIRCFLNSDKSKDTDTHFRNSDGKCSWNYRLLFPVTYPTKDTKMTVQGYDLDLFKSNDLIGQTVIDLKPMLDDCEIAKRGMSLTEEYYDQYLKPECGMDGLTFDKEDKRQFWVILSGKDKDGKIVSHGRLKMSIEILPMKDALANPVGEAQSEPNVNPFLPKPFGRIEFSINPFKMLAQLVGPAFLRKMYCYCCLAICCALCVMMAPMVLSNIVAGWFS